MSTHFLAVLTSEDSRAGHSIAVEVAIDVGSVSRIRLLEGTGNANTARDPGSASSDLNLSAADVELRDTAGIGVVDTELLDAKQVVTRSNARGDLDAVALWEGLVGV